MAMQKPRTALVTGATGNIGKAVAKRLLLDGYRVIVMGRSQSNITTAYGESNVQWGNYSNLKSKQEIDDDFGLASAIGLHQVYALVVCHGIAAKHDSSQLPENDFQENIHVNLSSALWYAQNARHRMNDEGRIVFMSSIHAQQTYPERAAYAVSKGGLEALARVLALEWGPYGITTNCIAPGQLDKGMKSSPASPEFLETVRKRTPTLKLATAGQVASLVAWLLSDDAAQVNGQTIRMDGGLGVNAWPEEFGG